MVDNRFEIRGFMGSTYDNKIVWEILVASALLTVLCLAARDGHSWMLVALLSFVLVCCFTQIAFDVIRAVDEHKSKVIIDIIAKQQDNPFKDAGTIS